MVTEIAEEIKKEAFTEKDVQIINLLRCEPPTLAFDFFGYGGLTRSVFKLLQGVDDLEARILKKAGEIVQIPCHICNTREHTLSYNESKGALSVIVNTYNNFSKQSDAKFLARAEITGKDNKKRSSKCY